MSEQEVEPEALDEDGGSRFPRIDWKEAFATDFSSIDFLPGRFMERGQQTALVAPGKVGKSILVQDWVRCAITGRPFLGDERRDPISVLYFDRENNLRDIVTRMISFGASPDDLDQLDYRMFPRFSGALDASSTAASELLAIVQEAPRDLVIFDTVSRFITGKENDADTWLQFYARVHAPLKALGVAGVRLDHMGKDEERGARGNSAKSQDVDHVWELTRTAESRTYDPRAAVETITTQLKFTRTHTRSGVGEDQFLITRRGLRRKGGLWLPNGTRHELTDLESGHGGRDAIPPGSVEWVVQQLDEHRIPADWGARKVSAECRRLGIRAGTTKVQEAVRVRKSRSIGVPQDVPYPSVTDAYPEPEEHQDVVPGQAYPGDTGGTSGDTPNGRTYPLPPTKEGVRPAGALDVERALKVNGEVVGTCLGCCNPMTITTTGQLWHYNSPECEHLYQQRHGGAA